ncbi:MAG: phosphatase PAP2 family protein [Candidatus Eisenbacteria bacterium]|nr:phosphatase PAP2 family protein [Candidatus Eisenbacteria bacterium]
MALMKAVALLIFLPVLASGESLDTRLLERIHTGWESRHLTQIMEKTTVLGQAEVGLGLCLILSTYGSEKEKETGKLGFTSLALTGPVVSGLKYAVGRERPYEKTSRANSSFPSGHAAAVFAVSSVIASEYPRLKIPAYVVAGAVAFSRVYLGRHYPSDVIVGSAVGYGIGKLVYAKRKPILALTF